MDGEEERAVARTTRRARADEWALVLLAEGIECTLRRREGRWALFVPAAQEDRAASVLAGYAREERPRRTPAPEAVWSGEAPAAAALGSVAALLLLHLVTGPAALESVWFERGTASARAIAEGAPWRAVTALTLHADAAHALGNALAGGLLWTLVGRALGPGLGMLAVVAAGTGGNLANALLRTAAHHSVGASTAVFGAVGLLGGVGATRRAVGLARRRWGVTLAACLGLLAMLGTGGGRTDVWAHAFGVGAGLLLGAALGRAFPRPPPAAVQGLCGALAVAVVVAAWMLAAA